ncbi:hypothetical protein B0H14DRAFT_898937 [Mycena olivaceomarginata]|nr:hypothetical protein B0H14DRAFT_898937 [Mycena olivaceomarginata]
MAGAHHLDLIRPAGYAVLPRSRCTTTTPVVRSIAIATSRLVLPWAPGTSLAAHRALCSIPCSGRRFGYRVRSSSSPGSYVALRIGVGPFLRGLGAPSPDLSAVCFPPVVSPPDFDVWTYAASTPAAIHWIPARRLASSVSVIPRDSPPVLPPPLVSPRRRLPSSPRPPPGLATRPRHWAIDFPLGNSDPALLLVPLLLDAAVRGSCCGVIGGEGEREEGRVWCLASALRRAMRSVQREHPGKGGGGEQSELSPSRRS